MSEFFTGLPLLSLSTDCLKLLWLGFAFTKFLGPFNHGNSHDGINSREDRYLQPGGDQEKNVRNAAGVLFKL